MVADGKALRGELKTARRDGNVEGRIVREKAAA